MGTCSSVTSQLHLPSSPSLLPCKRTGRRSRCILGVLRRRRSSTPIELPANFGKRRHEDAYCYSIDYQHVFRIPVEFAEQKPSNKTTENFSPMLNQSICAYIRSIRRRKSSTPIYSGSFSETVNTRLPTNRIKSRLLSSGLRGRLLDGGPSCRVSVALPIAILTQLEDLAAIH